jgi:hypothetical protein
MPINVTCTCGHKFRVDDQFAEQEGPCPGCQQLVKLTGERVPPFDVFLSYSSKDHTIADAAVAVLEQRGLRCWVAPRNIVAGKEWSESIIEGIEKSRLMVLIFSQHSNRSQQVVREVERAVAKGIPIIPFRIEDIPASKSMEYFISYHHWLDAYQPPLDKHLDKLADVANQLLENAPLTRPAADDAKGVAGKLNAAMNTLLARDKRTRVLVGLVALMVMAALLLGTAAFALREPVASQSLIEAKGEAEVVAASTVGFDPGDGVDARQAKIQQKLSAAAAFYADKQFSKAADAYRDVVAEAESLTEFNTRRATALEKVDALNAAKASAAEWGDPAKYDPVNWGDVLRQDAEAEKAYAAAEYERAAELWTSAAASVAAATENARLTWQPRSHALALWTAMAINYKWLYIKLAPQNSSGGVNPLAGGGLRGGRRPPFGGGLPSTRPLATDWPPYQSTVSYGISILDGAAAEELGIEPALIERVIETQDLGVLDATSNKIVDYLKAEHGAQADAAFRLGSNIARLKTLCEMGAAIDDPATRGTGIAEPTKADIVSTTDYALHRAVSCGCPADVIDAIKEIRRQYDGVRSGKLQGALATQAAFAAMQQRMEGLYEQHFATVEAATALFASCRPPEAVPEFPARSKALDAVIEQIEDAGGQFTFDLERWDRPPLALSFQFQGSTSGGNIPRVAGGGPPVEASLIDLIGQCTELQQLGAYALKLEDKHVAQLAALTSLRQLVLHSSKITDDSVEHLAKLKNLELLDVSGTQISLQGLDKLKSALPKCEVKGGGN